MIHTHCRHHAYPEPVGPFPTHCKAGVEYATLPYGRPKMGEGNPCDQRGHDAGRICPLFTPWTPEEIAADKAEWEVAFAALKAGRCPSCGGLLERRDGGRSRVSWCPSCPDVSMRECRVEVVDD